MGAPATKRKFKRKSSESRTYAAAKKNKTRLAKLILLGGAVTEEDKKVLKLFMDWCSWGWVLVESSHDLQGRSEISSIFRQGKPGHDIACYA